MDVEEEAVVDGVDIKGVARMDAVKVVEDVVDARIIIMEMVVAPRPLINPWG